MPASDLRGRVALVTGGGKGVGAAVARLLSARGVSVVVTGPDEHALGRVVGEIAAAGGKARHVVGDVRDPAHLEAASEKAIAAFGDLDIVIANARHSAVDVSGDLDRAHAIFETNLIGAYCIFHAATRKMKGFGRLIAVTNAAGDAGASDAVTRASASGVVEMMRAMAVELAPRQITCNAISVPRLAEPEQVAEVVLFLCTRGADAITGQALSVCGGATS